MSGNEQLSKFQEMIELSEKILRDLELENISLTQILPNCKRLARIKNDFEALQWFSLELDGYGNDNLSEEMKKNSRWCFYAEKSGRKVTTQDPVTKNESVKYWISSIGEIESLITSNKKDLESLIPPAHYEPVKTRHKTESGYFPGAENEYVRETYRDVLNHLDTRKTSLTSLIKDNEGLLSRIKNRIHDYVLNLNYKLRFENIADSIFERHRNMVEQKLSRVCPAAIREFVAIYDRLADSKPELWSQAMSSCRRVLKEFADSVFPASGETYIDSSGVKRDVTDEKIRNRLCAYIDSVCSSKSKSSFLKFKLEDIIHRVDCLYDLASKGVKAKSEELKKEDIDMCVIETFLLLGFILEA